MVPIRPPSSTTHTDGCAARCQTGQILERGSRRKARAGACEAGRVPELNREGPREGELSPRRYHSLADIYSPDTQKGESVWTPESFALTTKLLHVNPEFYTVWNYRRNILLNGLFPERYYLLHALLLVISTANEQVMTRSPPAEINDLLSDDLSLTTAFLKQHPKVYWIWNHRQWCLQQVPDSPTEAEPHGWRQAYWNKELFVVERMLDADPRNCEHRSLACQFLVLS